jgi:hypothetical protein
MNFIELPTVIVDFVVNFPEVVKADLICKFQDIVSYIISIDEESKLITVICKDFYLNTDHPFFRARFSKELQKRWRGKYASEAEGLGSLFKLVLQQNALWCHWAADVVQTLGITDQSSAGSHMTSWSNTANLIKSNRYLDLYAVIPDITNPPSEADKDLDERLYDALGIKKRNVSRQFFKLQRQIQSHFRMPTQGDMVWDAFQGWRVVTNIKLANPNVGGSEIGIILVDTNGKQTIVPMHQLVFKRIQKKWDFSLEDTFGGMALGRFSGYVWSIRKDGYLESFGHFIKWLLPVGGYIGEWWALTNDQLQTWGKQFFVFTKLYDGRASLESWVGRAGMRSGVVDARTAEIAAGQASSLIGRSARDMIIKITLSIGVGLGQFSVSWFLGLFLDNTQDVRLVNSDVGIGQRYYVTNSGESISLNDQQSIAAATESAANSAGMAVGGGVIKGAKVVGNALFRSGETLIEGGKSLFNWGSDTITAGTNALRKIFYGALGIGALLVISKFN